MTDETAQLVTYRLAQARDTLEAGRQLLQSGHHRDAINRAYYAMFYAVLGLLASKGLGTSKHTGALSLFGQHFVKEGGFPSAKAVHLREAWDLRQKCDYREFVEPEPGQASEVLANAAQFIAEAERTWESIRGGRADRDAGSR